MISISWSSLSALDLEIISQEIYIKDQGVYSDLHCVRSRKPFSQKTFMLLMS